jgi:hypothetical protein
MRSCEKGKEVGSYGCFDGNEEEKEGKGCDAVGVCTRQANGM